MKGVLVLPCCVYTKKLSCHTYAAPPLPGLSLRAWAAGGLFCVWILETLAGVMETWQRHGTCTQISCLGLTTCVRDRGKSVRPSLHLAVAHRTYRRATARAVSGERLWPAHQWIFRQCVSTGDCMLKRAPFPSQGGASRLTRCLRCGRKPTWRTELR